LGSKRFSKRKPTAEQILAGVRSTAQHFADITQVDTTATRTADGMVRYHRTDWPMVGSEVVNVKPVERVQEAA
jgi:hypothetical protein